MGVPCTLQEREQKKFVESPTRPNESAVEVVVSSIPPISVEVEDNIEQDFADGNTSAVKAVYRTLNGVALANNNLTLSEATVIGITITGATDGNKIKYKTLGKLNDSSFNFPLGEQIYLDLNGNITNVAPTTGFRTLLGTSNGPGEIQINIDDPIEL